ncbi:T9SS type A sorting domain-containing protein, partial [candidate division WOR-3 bacterium]|nr:T9SS type A sorting domain-containing protein [candidate division WOR-3 bacterium]
ECASVEEGIGYIFKNQKSNIKYQKLNTESRKDERFKSQKSKVKSQILNVKSQKSNVKSQKVEESKGQIYAAVAGLSGRINNISVIPNDIFIYPDGGLSDYYAYRFLSGELSFDEGEVPGDYSLLISFGPYCLFEGEGGEVAFAVIGGFSRDEILERFIRAQEKLGETGVEEEYDIQNPYLERLEVYPNPFIKRLNICLKSSLEDKIMIYDIAGRLVSILQVDNTDSKITGTVWDAEGVTSGIYFISTPQTVRKVVKLR